MHTHEILNKIVRLVAALFFTLPIMGCALYTPEAKHENFKELMSLNVGRSIDNPAVLGSTESRYLVKSRPLPNGNVENEYEYIGTCRKFFEFDPESRIIVSWRFEGSEKDCAIVP